MVRVFALDRVDDYRRFRLERQFGLNCVLITQHRRLGTASLGFVRLKVIMLEIADKGIVCHDALS